MDSDEREIFSFLKTCGSEFVNAAEISRRAGNKKRFHKDRDWAKPILMRMADRNIVESDMMGRFRIRPTKKKKGQRWVAPDIAKMLEEKGVKVEGAAGGMDEIAGDDYYEQL